MAKWRHRVLDGGCGGIWRTLYLRENDFATRTWRAVGRVCMGCRQVELSKLKRQGG